MWFLEPLITFLICSSNAILHNRVWVVAYKYRKTFSLMDFVNYLFLINLSLIHRQNWAQIIWSSWILLCLLKAAIHHTFPLLRSYLIIFVLFLCWTQHSLKGILGTTILRITILIDVISFGNLLIYHFWTYRYWLYLWYCCLLRNTSFRCCFLNFRLPESLNLWYGYFVVFLWWDYTRVPNILRFYVILILIVNLVCLIEKVSVLEFFLTDTCSLLIRLDLLGVEWSESVDWLN